MDARLDRYAWLTTPIGFDAVHIVVAPFDARVSSAKAHVQPLLCPFFRIGNGVFAHVEARKITT